VNSLLKLIIYNLLFVIAVCALAFLAKSMGFFSEYIGAVYLSLAILFILSIVTLIIGSFLMKRVNEEQKGTITLLLISVKFIFSLVCILILYMKYRDTDVSQIVSFLVVYLFYAPLISYTYTRLSHG